jgi:hypothetical protein
MHGASINKAPNSYRHTVAIALAAVSCAAAIAACGASGSPSSAAGTGSGDALALKFADCMRSHGVPNFPDPGRPVGGPGSGINEHSPAFKSAEKACGEPSGHSAAPPPTESDKLAAFAWAKCMRKHGVPNFPDPTLSQPSGNAFDYRGIIFSVGPGLDPQSPAFKQAQAACGVGPGRR